MFGGRLTHFLSETAKRILSFNTSSAEITSAGACILIGLFLGHLGMPANMLEFQLNLIWQFELVALGGIHLFTILYFSSNSSLRIWLSFISGLFWSYLMLSAFAHDESMTVLLSFIMALSMWTGFIARSFRWGK
jgi:hypothetical protein